MPQELPGLRCRAIDVDELDPGSGRAVRLCEDLIRELGQNEPVVAYRGGQRFARRFVPLPLPPPVRPRLRERGTYVITGGLGGVALALAEHLARKWRARLVLLHRSPLPERAAWRDWIDRHDGQDRTSSRLRRLLALEEAGAEVLPLQVDVTSAEQVSEALRRARERFGQIHGVLHAAGVLDDGLLLLKTRQAAEAVLAPKVRGAMALEAALDGEPLDFLVLFSSVSAFSGLAGQVDYAAANAFLDAFACSRAARNGSFTLSISWNAWQEVGMAAELATRLGLVSRPSRQGEPTRHPLLSLRLQGPSEERTFSSVLSEAHWILDEHRLKGGPALLPGTAYLELARAAFQHDHGPGPLEMREVVFLSAFAVAPAAERELRVVLRPEGERWSFRVLGDTGSGWQEHARGLIGRPAAVPPVRQDLEELAARCHGQRVTPGRSDPHMDFGPRWDNRVEVCYGQGEALLRLALPPAYAAEVAGLGLHPALLDHATAGAQGLIPGADPAQDFYVPISYGRILVHRPLPARLWSHVRCRTQTPRPDAVVFDVTLLDEEGVALCEIEDFVMRRLAQPAQLAPRQGRPARTVGNRILELGLSQGILPQEGAEALERVLAGPPVPQVVVSSQDLQALLGAIRTPARNEAAQPSRDGLPAVARPCRPALPTPYVAPRTDLERTIAAVWEEALGIAGIGVHDDFFDLGGHSLLLTQVISQVRRQTGAEVSLRDLFDSPTVAGLAAQIAQARSGSAITRVARAAYRVKRSAVGQARDEE
ncbi:MAG: SDR family NAD(P)-dependent oxidoreductase [Myxococcota bacterium]|nr:SDR family NAD(P)-dependent oxidoreductase [Myxococcota bacterium]